MTYSIGQVAEMHDLSIHTLRYYEKEGILSRVNRSESGLRRFCDKDIKILKTVECLKKSGMTLKEIKQFLQWCREGDKTLTARKDLFLEKRQAIRDQIAELQEVLKFIEYKCWYYTTSARNGSEDIAGDTSPDQIPEGFCRSAAEIMPL